MDWLVGYSVIHSKGDCVSRGFVHSADFVITKWQIMKWEDELAKDYEELKNVTIRIFSFQPCKER